MKGETVYVVVYSHNIAGDYEMLEGVFSSKEAADEYVKKQHAAPGWGYDVIRYIVR